MRVFLINFAEKEIAKKLAEKGLNIIYWTGKEQHFKNAAQEKEYFPGTIFHSVYDALKGISADNVKDLKLDFPPQEILKYMVNIEYQVLAMISRVDFKGTTHDQKVELFYKYLIYWYGVLKHFKPDALIFTDIPHLGFSYTIYSLAKALDIKTVMYRFLKGLPGRLIFFDDFKNMKSLRDAYARALNSKITYGDLNDEMKQYVQTQSEIDKKTTLTHAAHIDKLIKQGTKKPKALISWQAIAKNIKQGSFMRAMFKYFFMLQHKKDVLTTDERRYSGIQMWWLHHKWSKIKIKYRQEYESLQAEVDFTKKYVYFPLHLQPECNTNPLGGIYDDQILMARTIAASLPPGWLIYIKENPMQWLHYQGNFGRYKGYYKILNNIPNVKLAPADTSTFKLIAASQAVATLTGSAGLEALVRLKPVLMFGDGWYMDCDGVFKVNDIASCQTALNSIQLGYKPSEEKVMAFLYAVEQETIAGSFSKRYSQFSSVSREDNITNIANKLIKELNLS